VTQVERLEMPATIQAVLAARIDRLPEREKRVLQVASVIGKRLPEPLLAAVADLPAPELHAALAGLGRAEFLHEQALFPVTEYGFKHPLTHEVALGSQLRERRRQIHGAVARAIERQDAERLDERAALLAHHWEEAAETLDAARWHRRAADWVGRNDFAAAAYHWGRVRALVRELPDDREGAALGIAACMRLLSSSYHDGMRGADARALLEHGQTLANAIGDRRAHLHLAMVHGRALLSAGDVAASVRVAFDNRRAAPELGHVARANAWAVLADALGHAARPREVLRTAEEGLARVARGAVPEEDWIFGVSPYSVLSLWRGASLAWLGRIPEGLAELDRCVRLAGEDARPEMVGGGGVGNVTPHAVSRTPRRCGTSVGRLLSGRARS
jgi:hypothetical protein